MPTQKFMVLVDKSASQEDMDKTASEIQGGQILDTWTTALKGFSVAIDPDNAKGFHELQGSNSLIHTIEADGEVKTQ